MLPTTQYCVACGDIWNEKIRQLFPGEDNTYHQNSAAKLGCIFVETWVHSWFILLKFLRKWRQHSPRSEPRLLTLILLTWRKWWAPNNASKQQMGFNSAFKGLIYVSYLFVWGWVARYSDWLQAGRPGIESRWGWDFPHLSRLALGPILPPVQWVPGLSQG